MRPPGSASYRRTRGFHSVSVIGHSEGALVGLVAVQEAPVTALVLIGAPGRSFQETLRRQLSGQPEAVRARVDAVLGWLERGERVDDPPAGLEALFHVLKTVGESREANLQAYSDPAVPLSPALVEAVTRFLAPLVRVRR